MTYLRCINILFLFFAIQTVASFPKEKSSSNVMKMNTSLSSTESKSYSVGFIGFGTIGSSIAKGLLLQTTVPIKRIAVSRRSESKSSELKSLHPESVTVFDDNQEVLNESDVIFLCVLPEQMKEVLKKLKFNPTKHIMVSLVSTSVLSEMIELSGLLESQVFKMICLPSVSRCEGTCLLVPPSPSQQFKSLFDSLGGTVECADEKLMNRAMIPCNLMGPLYGIMRNSRTWLEKQGMPADDASYLVARQYMAMVQDALRDCRDPQRFDKLIAEQTPGGFNEQALRNLEGLGLHDIYDKTMDALLNRLEGKSDGSIEPASKNIH